MTELTRQLFIKINMLIILLTLNACNYKIGDDKLECLLESIVVDRAEKVIVVGQSDGWTDSTALISIIYYQKSLISPNRSRLKGRYKGTDVYFNQAHVDTLDKKKYKQITNSIVWHEFIPEEIDEDFISPPYDPINIQINYNIKRECFGDVIGGEGFINLDIISKCNCK